MTTVSCMIAVKLLIFFTNLLPSVVLIHSQHGNVTSTHHLLVHIQLTHNGTHTLIFIHCLKHQVTHPSVHSDSLETIDSVRETMISLNIFWRSLETVESTLKQCKWLYVQLILELPSACYYSSNYRRMNILLHCMMQPSRGCCYQQRHHKRHTKAHHSNHHFSSCWTKSKCEGKSWYTEICTDTWSLHVLFIDYISTTWVLIDMWLAIVFVGCILQTGDLNEG